MMSEILTTLFGFTEGTSQTILLGVITICVLSWLSLLVYLLFHEPKLLEDWKHTNLVTLGVIAIFGFSSFIVASLFLLGLVILKAIKTHEFSGFNFVTLVFFTEVHMLLALFSERYMCFAMMVVSFTKRYTQPSRWVFSVFSKKTNPDKYPRTFLAPKAVLRTLAFNFGIIPALLFTILPFLFLLERWKSGHISWIPSVAFVLLILLSNPELIKIFPGKKK